MRPTLIALAASTVLAGCATTRDAPVAAAQAETETQARIAAAATPAPDAQLGTFGFDTAGMKPQVDPGDDFFEYANGAWIERTEIPADKSNYGMFTALADLSQERVREILDTASNDPSSRIGAAYASYLDQASVEARGVAPIRPWLAGIEAIGGKQEYSRFLPDAMRNGVTGVFRGYVGQDDKDPDTYIYHVSQSGLGLPDRDYYLLDTPRFAGIREKYVAHVARMLELAGEDNARARAQRIFDLEKRIAEVHWTREDSSDAVKTYNKMTVGEFDRMTPGLDFAAILGEISPEIDSLIVSQPSALQAIAQIVAKAELGVLKDQLLFRSLTSYSDVLPDAIANESFAFYGTTLSGTPEREPRWKRGVGFTESVLGEEVGKEYAARHFPPETKAAMNELVDNVVDAMGRRIEGLEWMQPQTKARAIAKLQGFTTKIGYPDRWKDYAGLEIRRDDLFGNRVRASNWQFGDNIARLGEPIRRWEWGMLPQTVNAYANFGMREIVFPAAILQPPFFDPHADPAINYGGIGAVIGHEISHHFDDQGAKYDEQGRLVDWWTPQDVEAFEGASKALIAQYDAYEVLPGEFVKGEYTLGENIGDLAGLTIAYDAYKRSLGGREAPVIDGLTGDQRFFLGWAQVWRRKYREENLRQRLLTDSHSPSEQRVAVVRNLDAWYSAFGVTPEDDLYLPPEQRVRIW